MQIFCCDGSLAINNQLANWIYFLSDETETSGALLGVRTREHRRYTRLSNSNKWHDR
jgi:hypothetical protein